VKKLTKSEPVTGNTLPTSGRMIVVFKRLIEDNHSPERHAQDGIPGSGPVPKRTEAQRGDS
jgi:hypothetical protein